MKLALIATLACVGAAASAQSRNTADNADAAQFVEVPGSMEFTGRLIVKPVQFDDLADRGLAQADIEETMILAADTLDAYELHWYEPLVDHYVILIPEGHSENTLADQLMDTGLYEFVEPDWMLFPIGCPDDSRFSSQWHHRDDIMQSCLAWDLHTGTSDVTVGTCDTGVDLDHSDLLLHRKEGYNAVNRLWESNGGQIADINGHGTHVTGCSGANGNNNNGVSGVGWNFSHRMMRVSNSSGGSASSSSLTHGALTSIEQGDKVANVSYSGVTSSSVRSTATTIKSLGGLLCWAAGNDGRNLNWGDRDDDDVIVVGSSTSTDGRSSFSAYGRSVDIMAPGSGVYSTTNGGGYAAFSGTSMASPVCAGVIALIWSANPALTPDEVEAILKQGADDLGTTGVDDNYGWGRVNSYNSLLLSGAGGGLELPIYEPFDADNLDEDLWGTGDEGNVTTDADNEPSAPNSLNLSGTESADTRFILLADADQPTFASFYVQHQGVEQFKFLLVEYFDDNNQWQLLEIVSSDGIDESEFEFFQAELPAGAYHDLFKLRFTAAGADSSDNWYIDDIRIGEEFSDGCIADFNGDDAVNSQDVLAFLNAWSAGDDAADVNNDGSVNSQDVLEFLNVWNLGC